MTALALSTPFLGLPIHPGTEQNRGVWLVGLIVNTKKREKMKHETRDATHGCVHFQGHYRNQTPLDTQIFPKPCAGPLSARAGGTLITTVISTFFFSRAHGFQISMAMDYLPPP